MPGSLTQISLNENPISTIDDSALDGSANTLDTLSFSNARFKRIPDAMLHLGSLKHFTMYYTDIEDWNMAVMKHIGETLESFYLIQYGLKTWPDWIQYFSHLSELSITSSSFSSVPDGALDALAGTLTVLTLNNNSLEAVPKALSTLTVLQSLYLKDNKISDVGLLPPGSKIRTLTLQNNRISDGLQVSRVLRWYADTLIDFEIDHNQLTAVPDLSFMTNLYYLDFTYNKISDPSSGSVPVGIYGINFAHNLLPAVPRLMLDLPSVSQLPLTSNVITEIIGTNIPTWTSSLMLDYNLVTYLTDSSFPQNASLTYINLNYNPISQISASAFDNLSLLNRLDIQGAKLTRLPLALLALKSLRVLDIRDSTKLVCTCLEKRLGNWFKKMMPYNVIGDCGQTTIYDFFINLSPDCPTR